MKLGLIHLGTPLSVSLSEDSHSVFEKRNLVKTTAPLGQGNQPDDINLGPPSLSASLFFAQ